MRNLDQIDSNRRISKGIRVRELKKHTIRYPTVQIFSWSRYRQIVYSMETERKNKRVS